VTDLVLTSPRTRMVNRSSESAADQASESRGDGQAKETVFAEMVETARAFLKDIRLAFVQDEDDDNNNPNSNPNGNPNSNPNNDGGNTANLANPTTSGANLNSSGGITHPFDDGSPDIAAHPDFGESAQDNGMAGAPPSPDAPPRPEGEAAPSDPEYAKVENVFQATKLCLTSCVAPLSLCLRLYVYAWHLFHALCPFLIPCHRCLVVFFACKHALPVADIDRKFSNLAVSSDVPGPILARADGTAAPYDEDTSPGFGIDVIVHDAVMQYGPWADRQRYALMQLRVQANS
jgi:hypothetical protein